MRLVAGRDFSIVFGKALTLQHCQFLVRRRRRNGADAYISSHFFSPPLVRFGFEALSKALYAAAKILSWRTLLDKGLSGLSS